ncbi:DUF1990 family protein [Streptomyces sp. NBC_01465]|uniref:DUF1990 family protein n=1 Tax=Streptomyces sp. NBC_01465 TaxID=2903878 RepID=UPI002E347DD9|nr:DUF1990 domain-containing protein [Streptomyces sp. NBC_01465]
MNLLSRMNRTDRSGALNYEERGATRLLPLPPGYHHLQVRSPVGHGRAAFEAAGSAVTGWRMHRATGARVTAEVPRVEPETFVEVSLGFGPLRFRAPCEVIWTAYESERTGFAYGTRARHPECGEESFVVELAADGTVWFTVTAFSRPASWYTRLAGPLVPVLQRAYAHRLTAVLRRIADGAT